jgi:hypothetical protein
VEACAAGNATGMNALVRNECNTASKAHPIVVPQRALRRALGDALDAIGARVEAGWSASVTAGGGLPGVPRAYQSAELLAGAPGASGMLGPDPDVEWTPALAAAFEGALAEAEEREAAARRAVAEREASIAAQQPALVPEPGSG